MIDDTRIVPKIDVGSPDECWPWTAYVDPKGYGKIRLGERIWLAHRAVYTAYVGPIPEGLTIDHLCRNRACVNPDHLEAVPERENWIRGESPGAIMARTGRCQRGHSIIDPIISDKEKGYRLCRACVTERKRGER